VARPVAPSEMTEQEAREFVELLAVPEAAEPPPCSVCGCGHPLKRRAPSAGAVTAETRCARLTDRRPEAARLRIEVDLQAGSLTATLFSRDSLTRCTRSSESSLLRFASSVVCCTASAAF
jgi:hypothetical protein